MKINVTICKSFRTVPDVCCVNTIIVIFTWVQFISFVMLFMIIILFCFFRLFFLLPFSKAKVSIDSFPKNVLCLFSHL